MRLAGPVALCLAALVTGCAPDRGPPPEWVGLLEGVPCAEEARGAVERFGARDGARRAPPLPGGNERYRIPTSALGRWVELELGDRSGPRLMLVQAESARVVTFGDDCGPVTAEHDVGPPAAAPATPRFTDATLAEAVRAAHAGPHPRRGVVVYVWSPHMPLSVDGYAEITEAAERAGLALEPVLFVDGDRDFAAREAARVGMAAAALREAASVELVMRDALVHAPSILLIADRRIAPVLPGYRNAEGYLSFFSDFLSGG